MDMGSIDTGSMVAIASATLSILAAVVSGFMAQRSSKLEHRLQQERHRESKAEITEEIISRYREPLLLAANGLQSRLFNAVGDDYLRRFLYCGDPEEERYAREFSVYAVAAGNVRQVNIQWALIDLIDFLDPNKIRLTQNRAKLAETDQANRITRVPQQSH